MIIFGLAIWAKHCRVRQTKSGFPHFADDVLPPKASLSTVVAAHSYIGRIPTFMRYATRSSHNVFDYVDWYWTSMNIADRLMLQYLGETKLRQESFNVFLNMHSSSISWKVFEGQVTLKRIVFSVWMSFRSPVVYAEFLMAADLKHCLEQVLNWSLDGLSKNQKLLGLSVDLWIQLNIRRCRMSGLRGRKVDKSPLWRSTRLKTWYLHQSLVNVIICK